MSVTTKNRHVAFGVSFTNYSKNDEKGRRVVAGYASFDVIDRQNERITHEAMREALDKFMSNPEFANTHVMHGNAVVGKVIPEYTDKNGELWETKVDDTGTFIVSELRTDIKRADQTWELIRTGVLKSYSIGGLALNPKEMVCSDTGACHWEINRLEIHEFSYVDRPAVKGADFIIVKHEDVGDGVAEELFQLKAMACPLAAGSEGPSEQQSYKEGTAKSGMITMNDSQAKADDAVVDEPKPELAEPIGETEKQDATPILLEIRGMLEKLQNTLDHLSPQEAPSKKTDEPSDVPVPLTWDATDEQLDSLKSKYGEDRALQLLSVIGNDALMLIDTVKEEGEEAKPETEPVKETEEVVDEVKEEEAPAEEKPKEAELEAEKSDVIDEKIQVAVDAKLEQLVAKNATVQKRTPTVSATKEEPLLVLRKMATMPWDEVEALARGA